MRRPPLTDAERILHGISEDELQNNIRQLCQVLRLPYYHTHDSRRSPEGFPDVVAIQADHLIIRELKTMKGKPTPGQIRWLYALAGVRRVSSGIWRPDAWRSGEIENVLRGRA